MRDKQPYFLLPSWFTHVEAQEGDVLVDGEGSEPIDVALDSTGGYPPQASIERKTENKDIK